VAVTGLGSPTFGIAVESLAKIHAFYSRFVPENKLQANSIIDSYKEFTSIELSNRYFSSKKEAPNELHIPFTKELDPKGILERAMGTQFIRSKQNVVKYNRKIEKPTGGTM
jgi:hypothetical protein